MKDFTFDTIMVHAGKFHADDVCCVALAKMLKSDIQVIRTVTVPDDVPETTIICDIGRGEFDHHQTDNEVRENGVPYAAFGKMWRAFGHLLLPDEKSWEKFETCFVEPIDSADNGVTPNQFSALVGEFNPSFTEDGSPEATFSAFMSAVEFVIPLMERKIKLIRDAEEARQEVSEAVKNAENEVVVLDKFLPWQEIVVPSPNKVVVFPSNRGGWNCQAVPVQFGSFETKVSLLCSGFTPEELCRVEEGMSFVHPAGFLAAFDTKEHAISFATRVCLVSQ